MLVLSNFESLQTLLKLLKREMEIRAITSVDVKLCKMEKNVLILHNMSKKNSHISTCKLLH